MAAKGRINCVLLCAAILAAGGCETIYYGVAGPDRPKSASGSPNSASLAPAVPPACDSAGTCLSVLTWNTKHRDVPIQLAAVAEEFKRTFSKQQPDFILLQEVVFDRPASKGQDNTAAALAEQIGYQVRGEARDGGAEGVAILSRHPFEYFDHLHITARDALLSGGFPRVSVMGEFNMPGVGRVRVVNLHLTQRLSQSDIRRQQLQETLDWMARREKEVKADVIILGGDFNCEIDAPEIALMRDVNACGGLTFVDHNSRTPTSGKLGDPFERIDYVFIASPMRSVSSIGEAVLWRDGVPTADGSGHFHPSDHLPMLQVYSIGPTS